MKLLNIFKKEQKTASIKVQKLEKNQLEKVIGGSDILTPIKAGKAITKPGIN